MADIFLIEQKDLESPEILKLIHCDERFQHYWSPDWSPSFYSSLAYEGLISTAYQTEEGQELLLPEMQRMYAVLDWDNLHISRHIQRILNKRRSFSLTINRDFSAVLESIQNYHDPSWLSSAYTSVLRGLREKDYPCKILSVELWDEQGELTAGEVGYQIGSIYTSLSGFCQRDKSHNNWGTLQLVLLAQLLSRRGFRFWNMGHAEMAYKGRLGAKILKRDNFLERWIQGRDECLPLLRE